MVIIGLGKAGTNIANLFKVDKNYKVLTYDGGDNVPAQSSAEEYESKFTKKRELSRIKNKTIWFFVCGAGKISGATLRLLEQVKGNKINVVYIKPDLSILSDLAKKRHRVCSGVLHVFGDTEPIFGGSHEPKDISRIRTFAFREVEKSEKKLFFPLDNVTETCYIYSINETELEMNSNLISEIKGTMDKDIISSFSIYPTSHDYSYAYGIYYTHFTQEV